LLNAITDIRLEDHIFYRPALYEECSWLVLRLLYGFHVCLSVRVAMQLDF